MPVDTPSQLGYEHSIDNEVNELVGVPWKTWIDFQNEDPGTHCLSVH